MAHNPEPDITSHAWLPSNVKSIIACGSNSYIGLVNENTILKYPNLSSSIPSDPEEKRIHTIIRQEQIDGLVIEGRIYEALGVHPRILKFKGTHKDGLLLEYARNGSVSSYLERSNPDISFRTRLKWIRQAIEGVTAIHRRRVLHRNINTNNILLDDNWDIKLCDFQGRLLNPDGTIQLDGPSSEDAKSSMPRSDPNLATYRTDIFALGTAIYTIMEGHLPYEDLHTTNDADQIMERFRRQEFPRLDEQLVEKIVHGCWAGQYEMAEEVERDFKEDWPENQILRRES